MKRYVILMALALSLAMPTSAFALEVPSETIVQNLNGSQQVIKTYTISPEADPQELIEEPFTLEGYRYTFADIVKVENHVQDSHQQTETVTVETSKNDLGLILEKLAPTLDYDDGQYCGKLALDHTSIYTEAAGYTTRSYNVTETKTIGQLDRNDMSYVPATTVKDGRTLKLSNVEWQVTGTDLVGEALMPSSYQAVATYSGKVYYSAATGYITTADYVGEVTREGVESVTYQVTYQIDNAGPEYVVLPSNGSNSVTITFTDTPVITGSGSIRKVDADDPTIGLSGAVIRIDGVDNNFTGTYTSSAGGYFTEIPWDTMPIGSFVATEVAPPLNYTLSSDPSKVRQEFYWDGKNDVSLVFENDAKVKLRLEKKDDSGNPLPDVIFNILRDGQVIGTEATDAAGTITVPNITEGLYAFVESQPLPGYAKLREPVIVHVDQADVQSGGTITVTAANLKLPNLTIRKLDAQTKEPVPDTVFEIKGIHTGYHQDVTVDKTGTAVLTGVPVDSYEVIEKSVPLPYVTGEDNIQTIFLGPGENRELIFENLKQPELTISKKEAGTDNVIPGTVFTVEAIDGDYQEDWTTGTDGTVTKRVPPGVYRVSEKSVPLPFYLPDEDADRTQEISLNPGDVKTLEFENLRMPELTIYKEDKDAGMRYRNSEPEGVECVIGRESK